MATAKIPVEIQLNNAWLIRPGDKLVIGFGSTLDQEAVDQIRERIGGQLPGVEIVVIDQVAAMTAYRPEMRNT